MGLWQFCQRSILQEPVFRFLAVLFFVVVLILDFDVETVRHSALRYF